MDDRNSEAKAMNAEQPLDAEGLTKATQALLEAEGYTYGPADMEGGAHHAAAIAVVRAYLAASPATGEVTGIRAKLEAMYAIGDLVVYETADDRGLTIDEYVDLFTALSRRERLLDRPRQRQGMETGK